MVGLGAAMQYSIEKSFCGEIVFTGDPFFTEGLSFVLPIESNLTQALSRVTIALENEDEIETLLSNFQSGDKECFPERPKALTFRKMKWFFIIAFIACGLLLLEMLLDKSRVNRPRNTENQNDNGSEEEVFS